ncbi:META domain-containing protein [Phaeobacter gallaeciensis]|uniref:Heat shock protein n=1 Tax=Phaeobacter gallaeciensis TaxID=60890 RepID=A0AAC9Z618_9RHOB|nr:META domain-containing protein [Phaeobacter gallaeciensis]AHD08044.1 Heat shock protein [Phaeobacter gallaeciensis DSM 26640]ATE91310.1 Heat shock protein [Phaeobacter gallaeciensis]ATE95586.1 Heat shock protein [Phaeobacter gallaeciensis]ATE99925.1 Heat shock protein [Phaeobacter gallaeciensis]ATF04358.1 Heat shock protein [Phaeobacter gallaeciensis]
MKQTYFLILAILFTGILSACLGDETLRAYGGNSATWQLREVDGEAVSEVTTLSFPRPGVLAGELPCNRVTGQLTAPYPWFEVERLATTRMVCAALQEETDVLAALQAMEIVEIKGAVMILSNEAGREMIFTAAD